MLGERWHAGEIYVEVTTRTWLVTGVGNVGNVGNVGIGVTLGVGDRWRPATKRYAESNSYVAVLY